MDSEFRRRYRGESPSYEIYYGKVDVGPERALWFRYTILDGASKRASLWAIRFDGTDVTARKDTYPLEQLSEPHTVTVPEGFEADRFSQSKQVYEIPGVAHLDGANAIGRAGDLKWDLRLADSGRRFNFLPKRLQDSFVASSNYASCLIDSRATGEITDGEEVWQVDGVTAMVGHIWGSRNRARRWGWSHCNQFDDHEDAVFEGLSVALGIAGPVVLPPLTGCVLWVDGERYVFRSPLEVIRAETEFGRNRWTFQTQTGDVTLEGSVRGSNDKTAVVTYEDTDGSNLWCYNSKLSDLTLRLDDPERDGVETLRSTGSAAYEYVTRNPPEGPIDLE